MIEGLSHITFIVSDLDKMERMLTEVLDAKKVYDSGDETFSISRERFFDIGGLWIATMEGNPLAEKTYNHVAFKIPEGHYEYRLARIKHLGLEVLEGRLRDFYAHIAEKLVSRDQKELFESLVTFKDEQIVELRRLAASAG